MYFYKSVSHIIHAIAHLLHLSVHIVTEYTPTLGIVSIMKLNSADNVRILKIRNDAGYFDLEWAK